MNRMLNTSLPALRRSPIALLAAVVLLTACDEERADAYGNFESREVVVSSQATGPLERFDLTEGDRVDVGQVVALVDTTQLALQAREQSLVLEAARTRSEEARAQLRGLEAQLNTAQVDYERTRRLFDQNASTSAELNRSSGAVAALTEQSAAAQARVRLVGQDREVGEARLAQLRDRMDRSTVRNPVSGTVLTTMVEPGEFVQAGRPLYAVAPLDSLILRAYVSGNQLSSLRLGEEVTVSFDAGDGSIANRAGRLTWIASEAEFTPTPIQTRDERVDLVYAVKVIVPNPDGELKIGMPAELTLGDGRRLVSLGPAVEIEGVSHSFSGHPALQDVTARIEHGEIFGFIGPDGAGKTTLFRILTTLIDPDSGSARVLDLDVRTDLWKLRRRVGYMPGRFSLYRDLTVAENLDFFATAFGTTVEAEYETIAPIYRQIEPFKDRLAGDLSGGMKQKLALSCALVHRPDILFLDEPTTGVDAVSRREFWDLLEELRSDGLTIVVSTPYMDEADRCDRVALIQDGTLLATDTPQGLVAAYPLPLIEVRHPDRYRLLLALRDAPNAHSVFPFGESLHYTDRRSGIEPESVAAEIRAFAQAGGFVDASAEAGAPGIEDTFMLLMGSPTGTVA